MSSREGASPEVREKAQEILNRLKNDPSFKQQIESDPEGTLTAARLPKEAVGDFLRETDLAEVGGYTICNFSCLYTCVRTG